MSEQALLDQCIQEYYSNDNDPGCAVMLWRDGSVLSAVRGVANIETRDPITSVTNFRLASVSKQFTAACILHLYERKLLRLTQSLCDIFPDFPDYGGLIQIEHLLRHTSGVKDYEALVPKEQTRQVKDPDVLQLLATEVAGDFLPGERFRYSNSGYALLAMVVEAVSGQRFADYLNEHIFVPLGMTGSLGFIDEPGRPVPQQRAIGYEITDDGSVVWADQNVTTGTLGDGGIYCSVEDYAKWVTGYLGGQIIKPELLQKALSPSVTVEGQTVPYGYGWRLEASEDGWQPYHPGSTSGFRNGVMLDLNRRWAVAVFSNRRNGDAVAVARAVRGLFSCA